MSTITLTDLRKMEAENKAPLNLFAVNLSNIVKGREVGPLSRVVISINGINGRERIIKIEPTIATTDLLDQASFLEIMSSPQFMDSYRKGIFKIVSADEAKAIDESPKALRNLSNRAKLRGTPAEEIKVDGVGSVTKAVTDYINGITDENSVIDLLDSPTGSFGQSDLISALALISNPSSDIYSLITEKLSDFEPVDPTHQA